jgi:phosphatidylserine decarboxylase
MVRFLTRDAGHLLQAEDAATSGEAPTGDGSPRTTPHEAPGSSTHPEALRVADRCYIVPWGRKECTTVLAAACLCAAGVAALATFASLLWLLALVPVVLLGGFFTLFFRNPRRVVPSGPGLLVAPADGTVWDIGRVHEPEFVGAACVRIDIFLSVFDVHVNRSPARGRIEWVSHREGAFHDARSPAAERENESNWIGLVRDDDGGPRDVRLLVKQVSGAIARRIVSPLEPPVSVARGGLIGMIKYGSRTELWIPADSGANVLVRVGDKVKGGETVLAAWSS